jgi:7-cyano-7-deazaguanine synthase in queuosine biosynthesis
MKALLVKSKSQTEMKFISDLLKKLGVSTRVMDIEDMEDYGMSVLLKEADRSKKASREAVMKKLKSK